MHRPTRPALIAVLLASLASTSARGQSSSGARAPGWARGAVCYEIFVRSFQDSDGDGVGDLKGLIQKLDYINTGNPHSATDLGARCIWLMPIAESPSYHGYDVSNYYRVQPAYGTNDDFKRFVKEAHRRGIRVLVDLVLNHASSAHPAFQAALHDSTSRYRGWFRWSPTKPNVRGPWGQQVWHRSPVRDEYYYGLFEPFMPDLNYENPAVIDEAKNIARFWLTEMGVDGFRLDAVPYLVEEGNQLNHTAGTHAVLREFGTFMHRVAPRAFTIGEVSDSTGVLLSYYPDQLDAYFAFDLADAILEAVRTGSATKLLSGYMRFQKALPATRWSPFLRNHDQTRTLTALSGDVARAKLAVTLLLTLPGLPFVYYGEEIGMTGDKPDPRLRTPMQWNGRRAGGFTTGTPWEGLQPDSLTANVESQTSDPTSLLTLYRRLIHLRAQHPALGSGTLAPLDVSSDSVIAYVRRDGTQAVLVIANLGSTPLSDVKLSSAPRVLRAGRYVSRELLGRSGGADLEIARDGRLAAYVPLPSLAPLQSYVFALSSAGR
ncbi:MAG: alpha-amylase family glycosyl hydrolase [Gemmatimonadaceae bacterium]